MKKVNKPKKAILDAFDDLAALGYNDITPQREDEVTVGDYQEQSLSQGKEISTDTARKRLQRLVEVAGWEKRKSGIGGLFLYRKKDK